MPFLMLPAMIYIHVSPLSDTFEFKGVTVISVTQVVARLKGLSIISRQTIVAAIQDEYKSQGYPLAVVTDVEQKGDSWTINVVEGKIRHFIFAGSKKTNVNRVERVLVLKGNAKGYTDR